MFNAQEQEIIKAGRTANKSPDEIAAAIRKYRTGYVPPAASPVKDIAVGALKGAAQTVKSTGDIAAEALPNIVPGLNLPGVRERVAPVISAAKDKLHESVGLTEENLTPQNDAERLGRNIELGAEIATPFVASRLARIAPRLISTATEAAPNIAEKVSRVVSPKNTPAKAVAQIAQGATKSHPAVANTIANLDIKGVKTYKDLLGKINKEIPTLAGKVDSELAKDATAYKLDDLAIAQATKGGAEVKTDYITRALDDLTNLYDSTGDDLAKADIQEVVAHAKANGLTRKEVNDISRLYGEEFGEKAFSKTGDPLTSTNAQAFETTRKGLKETARAGLGGSEAKAIDSTLSDFYETRKLVKKNVEAVNKLQAKIQDRGLLEKAGYIVSKYADIATGGTIRGFVGGILPRGAGYKTMNALDIEESLAKNLEIIQKALAADSDEAMLKILKQNDKTFTDGLRSVE